MNRRWMWAMLALGLTTGTGCIVRERVVAPGPSPCPGGVWIQGHYGPRGHWHRGHWRCPNVIEVVEPD